MIARTNTFIIFIFLSVLAGSFYSETTGTTIDVTAPVTATLSNNSIIDLGTIGPGQTMYIDFNPRVKGVGFWAIAKVEDVPDRWYAKDSKKYEVPLHVRVTSAEDAPEGEYYFKIRVIDEGNVHGWGNITVRCKIRIKHDIMDLKVTPQKRIVGAGQPARFNLKIVNKGNTEDEFVVRSEGVKEWSFQKHVYIPAKSDKDIIYDIIIPEEEVYHINIIAESYNSPYIIHKESNVTVDVHPNLISDMKATNNGLLLFPIMDAPAHSILGLFSNMFN
ncbi:hypothetical protein J7J90_04880 [Candidatus Micrarchaeota archaeon]|nr:hypothetical protein [Candidatus Micrarchaeota archaeon]